MKSKTMKIIIFMICSSILIFFDQWTKWLAVKYLSSGKIIDVIPNILQFVYVENTGAAFGILKNQKVLFTIITIIVIVGIIYYVIKMKFDQKNIFNYIVLLLIFSGAIGNFIDRIKKSYVVDFIYFKPINFPVFNVADTYITIACIVLLISMFLLKENNLQ